MRRIPPSLALAALLVPTAAGQDAAQLLERFELFNACKPMQLLIEDLHSDAADIGLTKEALQAAAESRLRAARLYTEDYERADFARLYVNVNVVGPAYSISVEYQKTVRDVFRGVGTATTWDSGSAGTHEGDADYIVSPLSQHLDRFLAAYLRVNEEACGAPAPRP